MPKLSIIIVTYLSRDEIVDCLESISESFDIDEEVEVIVVENNSGDGIDEIIKSYPWVNYINLGENLGFGKANNRGYEHADGEYILFLNPDTIVNRKAIMDCLELAEKNSNYGFISPKLVMKNGELDLACRRKIPNTWDGLTRASGLSKLFPKSKLFAGYNLTYLPIDGTYEVGSVNGAFMLISKKNLMRVGIFDEQYFMYAEDLDLCYRATISGYKNIYYGSESIIHIKGQSSKKVFRKMSKEIFRATLMFYEKFYNPHNSFIVSMKYKALFGLWYLMSRLISKLKNNNKAQPV